MLKKNALVCQSKRKRHLRHFVHKTMYQFDQYFLLPLQTSEDVGKHHEQELKNQQEIVLRLLTLALLFTTHM